MPEITSQRFRELAKDLYQDEGRIEIDDGGDVRRADEPEDWPTKGAYVQAWVWVGVEDEDEETDECADNISHPTDSCPAEEAN